VEQEEENKMATHHEYQRNQFPEPRGWAMDWVFIQEFEAQVAEIARTNHNGAGCKFAEPQGWSVEWDGFALDEVEKQESGRGGDPRQKA
jgi:hypothetical protein